MHHAQEIVIDSDDNEGNFSDKEEFPDEPNNQKVDTMDYTIEAIDKAAAMEIEERIPYDTKVQRNRNKKSRLIEEMMIEDMDIQNENYVLKKVKASKDKSKGTPQDSTDINKNWNFTESESDILQSDVPERLQYLYGNRPRKVPQDELEVEAKWITRRLERKKKLNVDCDSDPLVSQVMIVLDLMKNQYYEVMYIYTYRFNEIIDLTLEDLWFIQNRDLEWIQMSQKKALLIRMNEEKITHEPTQNYIENLIINTFDEYTLENISSYIQYKELTISPANSTFQLPVIAGLNMNELYADVDLKDILFDCLSEIFLTPEDFAYNLKNNNLIRTPKTISQRPADYFQLKKNLVPMNNRFTENMMNFFQTITFLMAYELYFHPLVKAFARRIYHEKVKISTRPKPKPNEETLPKVDMYKPDYCVKRIKNRPFAQFKADETGIYLLKNATEGKIDICFHTSDEIINIFDLNALSPDRDGMLKHLVARFISQENEDDYTSEWNLIRKECINFLVHHLLYPHLQKELEKDILETSEKAVINSCADKLKYVLCNGPCMSANDEKTHANIISITMTDDKQILAVAVDKDGFYQDSCAKMSYEPFKMMNSQQTVNNIDSSKKEEYHNLAEFIYKNRPDYIVIGDYRISRRVIRKIVRDHEDTSYSEQLSRSLIYCSAEISKLQLDAPKSWIWNQYDSPELDQEHKIAINLARMQQDALCEVAKLWSERVDENQLLKIHFHELQAYVNRQKLMQRYQEVLIETVNKSGVDLNHMLQTKHRSAPLQFICGLGPIKAQYFLGVAAEKGTSLIKQRNLIFRFEKNCFQDKIFWNASGFIKIEPPKDETLSDEYKPLDQTRIHPSWYGLAKKIEKDTFEDIPESFTSVLDKASHYPDLLREVDIEDFASHLEQSKGMKNMKPVLEFIINELINPFKRYRRPFSEWNQEYLFFKMTGLSPFYCQIGSIVQGTVTKTTPTFLNVRIDSGIEATIYKHEIFEKEGPMDLTKEFYEGQAIVARITNLSYENFKTDFSSLVKITLTLKPSILNNHKDFILAVHPNLDEYNVIDPNNDYPVLISNKRKKTNFTDRMIMHNKFKNITADEAIDLLEEKEIGEFLFRPGKRIDQIFITWKFYDHIYTHLEIHEGDKVPSEPISKKLTINKKCFSSLNEIIAHYITPCNKFVKTIIQHPKFFRGDMDTILQQLHMEKEAEPKFIPYHILFSRDAPQHALLCYLKNNHLETEYIKIDGNGYSFHDALFIVFDELIRFFKNNQNKPDYINYLHTAKKPFVEVILDEDDEELPSRSINSGFGIETLKWKDKQKVTFEEIDRVPDQDSIKVKQEKRAPVTCENCQVRGHQANQCPLIGNKPRRGGFGGDNRRNSWNPQGDGSGKKDFSGRKASWAGKPGQNNEPQTSSWGQDTQQDSWGQPAGDTWGSGMQVESTNDANKGSGWGQDSGDTWGNSGAQDSWGGGSGSGTKEKGGAASWGDSGGQASWGDTGKSSWGDSGGQTSWGASKNDDEPKSSNAWGSGGTSGWGSGGGDNKWGNNDSSEANTSWGNKSGGRQRRDDGDQKPKGKGCFKCGEEGHMSRECPNAGEQKPRSKGCFKCGEEGHMSRECPNPGEQKPRSKGCFKCGQEGHMSRECPNPGEQKPRSRACFKCGEEGHMSKDCTNPRKEGAGGDRPRGGFKPRGEGGWNKSKDESGESSWGNKGDSGWGAGKSDNSWGDSKKNDSWGSTANDSGNNKSGWGGGGNNDSWGAPKNDAGWGSTQAKGGMEEENNGTWGASSSKPAEKSSNNDSWGAPAGDSWGEPAKPEAKASTNNDSWGAPAKDSWGESSSKPAASGGDSWGEPAKPEAKASTNNDSWGAPAKDNSWGESPSKPEKKSAEKESWGSPQKEAKKSADSGWGASSGDTWGETPKPEIKAAATSGDSWGASAPKDSWGEPAKPEAKTSNNDSWGGSPSKQENKASSGDSWGAPAATDSWGGFAKPEPKAPAADSWGNSSKDDWGSKGSDQKAAKTSPNDSWGASGGSTWGEPAKPEQKSSNNDSWGASGGGWGESSKADTSSNSWGGSQDSWGGSKSGDQASQSSNAWGSTNNSSGWGNSGGTSSWGGSGGESTSGGWSKGSGGNSWGKSGGGDGDSERRGNRNNSRGPGERGESRGPKTCFKCGQEGHMSRECPNPGEQKPRSKGCFKCGQEGHMSRECPNPGEQKPKGKGCFKCGQEGHMSRECPNPGEQKPRSKGCFKCGQEGHMSRECPNPGEQKPRSRACFKCGEEGHMSKDCTNPNASGSGFKPKRKDGSRSRSRSQEKGEGRPRRQNWQKDGDNGGNGGRRGGWNKSGDSQGNSGGGWGKSEGSGSGWGKSNESGWGSTGGDSGWGKSNNDSGWGSTSGQNNDSGWGKSNNDSWGTTANKPSTQESGGWGQSSNDTSGTPSNKNNDGWGASNAAGGDGGWGSENKKSSPVKNQGNNWSDEKKSFGSGSKNEGWGAQESTGGGWGNTGSDNAQSGGSWGEPEKKDNNGGWGETQKKANKQVSMSEEEGQIGTWDNKKAANKSKAAETQDSWGQQQTSGDSGWGVGGGW